MYGYCEDYPCCGHTDRDPCPGRGEPAMTGEEAAEFYYCDECGYSHTGACRDDYEDEPPEECGRTITYGPKQDPYGVTCDLEPDHDGPHEGDDALGAVRVQWTGGGYAAGDPLYYHIIQRVSQ